MPRSNLNAPTDARSLWAIARLLLTLAVGGALVAFVLVYGFISYTNLAPERVEDPGHELAVDETGRRVRYGDSYLARRGRLWTLHLEGSPEEIGSAHGMLLARQFVDLDERVVSLAGRRYPTRSEAWAELMRVRWQYRTASAALRESDRHELSALARAIPAVERSGPSTYHRLFLHQCFLDLTQRLDDVIADGVAFASVPQRGPRGGELGNLVVGRSFSIDLGHDFQPARVVNLYYPDGRYPFASVSWVGQVGVVTGINSRGIFIAVNPARTEDTIDQGLALPILARRVMEEADSLERALELLTTVDVRSAGVVLVADGNARKAVVVELGPRARDSDRVIRGEGDPVVWATDHMLREPFDTDANNDRIRRTTSSGQRYDRIGELLARSGTLSPEHAAEILRDRAGPGNAQLGLGNRNALETLAVSHAVVVDATAMVMWVAEGPSALGRFRAFDLRHLLSRHGDRPAPLDDLPADRLLYSEEYNDWLEAQIEITHARELLARRELGHALTAAKIALALAPDIGDLHRLLGDIEREMGNTEQARVHYERYLELVPGRLRDQEVVRGILQELDG